MFGFPNTQATKAYFKPPEKVLKEHEELFGISTEECKLLEVQLEAEKIAAREQKKLNKRRDKEDRKKALLDKKALVKLMK